MTPLAAVVLDPASFAAWIIVGAICGWLAGKVMKAPGYGSLGEIFFGSLGDLIGGAFPSFFMSGNPDFWGTTLAALIGAGTAIVGARVLAAAARVVRPTPPTHWDQPLNRR